MHSREDGVMDGSRSGSLGCMMSLLPLLLECSSQGKWYFSVVVYTQGTVLISQRCSVANGLAVMEVPLSPAPAGRGAISGCVCGERQQEQMYSLESGS